MGGFRICDTIRKNNAFLNTSKPPLNLLLKKKKKKKKKSLKPFIISSTYKFLSSYFFSSPAPPLGLGSGTPKPPSTFLPFLEECLDSYSNKICHFLTPPATMSPLPLYLNSIASTLWLSLVSKCMASTSPPKSLGPFLHSNIFHWCCTNATCNYLVVDQPWPLVFIFGI